MSKDLKLVIKGDIANLTFNLQGEKVNKLTEKVLEELSIIIDKIANNKNIKLLTISSEKKDIFIAGADINEIKKISSKKIAYNKVRAGQDILFKLENLQIPTIAIIEGACLGGGLELALSCKYRFVIDDNKTKLGLPEVNLGIIPGFGGTQRLPRLIGLEQSLKMILTGKAVDSKKSYKICLADAILKKEFAQIEINQLIKEILQNSFDNKFLKRRSKLHKKIFYQETILLKKYLIFYFAKKNLIKKIQNFYPAPLYALNTIAKTYNKCNKVDGCEIEARRFSQLASGVISKNLINIFFATESIKKKYQIKKELTINNSSILGAGIMGGGIAFILSKIGVNVRMKDVNNSAIALGYGQCLRIYQQLIKIRKITKNEASRKLNKISHSLNYNYFNKSDIVIEAVIEDINIKKSIFSELENHINKSAIIASNTSSLSIDEMAKSLKYPERFAGMHFFNPVNRMPLVEIIKGESTSQKTIDIITTLTLQMGKTPIIVKDVPGFLVNRILLPFMNESAFLLEEDGNMEKIDKIISQFGMPMGPFVLADTVGIDVGYKVAKSLFEGYGKRMKICPLLTQIAHDKNTLGKKTNLGFYKYNKSGKNLGMNPNIKSMIEKIRSNKKIKVQKLSSEEIIDRSILIMINEASRCLEESVVENATELDIAMIYGTGFPPFRGGLLRYADQIGSKKILSKLKYYSKEYGSRFNPSKLLVKMAKTNERFIEL